MLRVRFLRILALLVIAAVVQLCYGQMTTQRSQAPTLGEFFQTLVEHYDPSSLPPQENRLKVADQIPGASPEDISKALPWMLRALAHADDRVKANAAFALTVIGRRPDSAELLRNHVSAIAELFNSQQGELQNAGALILGSLRPVPPPEIVPPLLALLRRNDRAPQAQATAVFYLVRYAPEKPGVAETMQELMSRSLDSSARIDILNALGNPRSKDARVIEMVIASLDDANQGVRLTAIQALTRMGRNALLQAKPALQKVAENPDEAPEAKAAAKQALRVISTRTD